MHLLIHPTTTYWAVPVYQALFPMLGVQMGMVQTWKWRPHEETQQWGKQLNDTSLQIVMRAMKIVKRSVKASEEVAFELRWTHEAMGKTPPEGLKVETGLVDQRNSKVSSKTKTERAQPSRKWGQRGNWGQIINILPPTVRSGILV